MLEHLDPENANKLNKNDIGRIIRSLEIIFLTGEKVSRVLGGHGFAASRFDARVVCIMPERESLYRAIDARVHRMIDAGLVPPTR